MDQQAALEQMARSQRTLGRVYRVQGWLLMVQLAVMLLPVLLVLGCGLLVAGWLVFG